MEVLVHWILDRWRDYTLFGVLLQFFEKTVLQKLNKNVFTKYYMRTAQKRTAQKQSSNIE